MELKQAWDQKTIRSGMKVAGIKGQITKAAFSVEPLFDGIGASEEKIVEPRAEPAVDCIREKCMGSKHAKAVVAEEVAAAAS